MQFILCGNEVDARSLFISVADRVRLLTGRLRAGLGRELLLAANRVHYYFPRPVRVSIYTAFLRGKMLSINF